MTESEAHRDVLTQCEEQTNQLSESQLFRMAMRRDVDTLYSSAGACAREDIPAITVLSEWVTANQRDAGRFDALEWAIGRMGKGAERSRAAMVLMGLGTACGWTQQRRWKQVATILGYKNADSFRNSKQQGRRVIDIILDEVTRELVALAEQCGIIESVKAEELRRLMPPGVSILPVVVPLPTGTVLARDLTDAYLGDMLVDAPFVEREPDD